MHSSAWYKASAQKALTNRYWLCVLAALIAGVLGGAASVPTLRIGLNFDDIRHVFTLFNRTEFYRVAQYLIRSAGLLGSTASIVVFLVGGAVEQGYDLYNVALFTGDPVEIPTLFARFTIFGKALWLRLFMALRIFAWSLLLFVPGVIASFRYALAPFLMAEYPQMTASEAIERSKTMMEGKKWQLFCLYCSFIGWYLLAALTYGIGAVFLAPYVKAAETAFYLDVSGRMAS